MLLFHGTKKCNVKSILKHGLQVPRREYWESIWWSREIGLPPSVFLSNQPKAGIGSSPLEFAAVGEDDGYLVVLDIPSTEIESRTIGIWTTHDIDMYWDLGRDIDSWYEECLGRDHWDVSASEKVLEWVKAKYPQMMDRICLSKGWICSNPEWLRARKKTKMDRDSQILVKSIPPRFVQKVVKVYDGTTGKVLPRFDPKQQAKKKHKEKIFASLVWHEIKKG